MSLADAVERILQASAGREITVFLDGNLPVEQLQAASAWCRAWRNAELCLVIEPAERDLLMGLEASDAPYLPSASWGERRLPADRRGLRGQPRLHYQRLAPRPIPGAVPPRRKTLAGRRNLCYDG